MHTYPQSLVRVQLTFYSQCGHFLVIFFGGGVTVDQLSILVLFYDNQMK